MTSQRPSHRVEKVADSVRRELSRLLLFDVRDPKLRHVTITQVRMTADLKEARIYYDWTGTEGERVDIEQRLEHAAPFLRRELAQTLTFKFVPRLFFHFDETRSLHDRATELLSEVTSDDNGWSPHNR